MSEDHILFEVKPGYGGDVGVVTLNRPDALNALTLSMLENLQEQMEAWESDNKIKSDKLNVSFLSVNVELENWRYSFSIFSISFTSPDSLVEMSLSLINSN